MKRIAIALLFGGALHADMLTPESIGNQWAQFNPEMGTLTQVLLTVSAKVGSSFTFAQNQNYQQGQNTTVSGQLTAVLTACVTDSLNRQVYSVSGSRLMYGTGWAEPTAKLDLSGVVGLWNSWTSGLDAFQGYGNWNLDLSASSRDAFIYWPKGVTMFGGNSVFMAPWVAVTYEYDPYPQRFSALAIPVPEPGYWIPLVVGAVWLIKRRMKS